MVAAGDLSRHRVDRLQRNLQRSGSGREHPIVADARRAPVRPVDAVLLDAPCLGTGTFARHPDARTRVTAAALERIAGIQGELLDALTDVVAPGGLLIYSTCSLEFSDTKLTENTLPSQCFSGTVNLGPSASRRSPSTSVILAGPYTGLA